LSKREPDISDFREISPLDLVRIAISYDVHRIVLMTAEPALHHEYVSELARLCGETNLSITLLTSGYLSPCLVEKLAESMTMVTVGIKASANPEVYRSMNADPIVCLESARIFWRAGKLIGIQDLIGPELETPEDDDNFARWVSANISPDVPVMILPLTEPSPIRVKWGDNQPCVESEPETRKRILETATRLREGGITNIHPLWVRDELK
jgi:pyruvate-formate lyase-activating enzyme